MQINISNLAQGIHTYSLEAAADELQVGQYFASAIAVEVTLDKGVRQILLEAVIPDVRGRFVCDRCLEEFERVVQSGYKKVYYTRDIEAVDLTKDDLEVLTPDTNIIDITNDVRDALLLAVPLKLLCREDCAGLCPRCGINLNSGSCGCAPLPPDARWEPLARLRDH